MGNVLADCVEVVQVRIQIPAVGESADGGCPQLIVQAKKNLANGDVAKVYGWISSNQVKVELVHDCVAV